MKNIFLVIILLVAIRSNAQQIMFQRHNNLLAPTGPVIAATNGLAYLTNTTAMSGGNVTSDKGSAVTAKGVVWSTSSGPTVSLSTKTNDGTGIGNFTSTLTGLTLNTVYYIRSYATNAVGTSYGPEVSFAFINTVTSATGKIWMDRNLGATRAAISSTDASSFGDLYQWGRSSDGHQLTNSGTTPTQSATITPGNSNFIKSWRDWLTTSNNNLWQGVNGINNPCPAGFRIPTKQEWMDEAASWSTLDASGAFASPLKLPNVTSFRNFTDGAPLSVAAAYYWSSSIDEVITDAYYYNKSYTLRLTTSDRTFPAFERGYGFSCRCIQNY